jgi:two-component system cell cycle sensor histidine kinase/response regulator CckA
VVADARKMLSRLIGDDVEIITHLDAGLGSVVADSSQMNQVLMNLAINARDAMPDGGRIIMETMNTDLDEGYAAQHAGVEAGPYVLLSITDTGAGMTRRWCNTSSIPSSPPKRLERARGWVFPRSTAS